MRVKIEERAKKRKESEGTEKKDETTILRRRRRPLFKNHLAFFFWFSIFIALVLSVDLVLSFPLLFDQISVLCFAHPARLGFRAS